MNVIGHVKYAFAAALLGGVLTACEAEYDPTAADTNTNANDTNEVTTGEQTPSPATGDPGIATGNEEEASDSNVAAGADLNNSSDNSSSDGMNDPAAESSTIDDQQTQEQYGIRDETDGSRETDNRDTEDNRASDMQAATTDPDQPTGESADSGFDDGESTRSDMAATMNTTQQQAVQFDFDSSELTDEAKSKLEDFVNSMEARDQEAVRVVIKGYTDTAGSEEYNQALAQKRAESVKNFLVEQGMRSDNLEIEAVGEAQPEDIAANTQDSRRVVVELAAPDAEELTAN